MVGIVNTGSLVGSKSDLKAAGAPRKSETAPSSKSNSSAASKFVSGASAIMADALTLCEATNARCPPAECPIRIRF